MKAIYQQFPALYQVLLPEIMDLEMPPETKADCSNCVMVKKESDVYQKHVFRQDTKCCTYHPRISNFLIGGLLSDPNPGLQEGQRRVREKIQARVGISPWFIDAPQFHTHIYKNVQSAFGKSALLRCPFYESEKGNCTVWAYREAVCSTWYCKYSAGKDGLDFWVALKKFVGLAETQMARYAMMQIDPEFVLDEAAADHYTREGLTLDDLDGVRPDDEAYRKLWRDYAGREEAFYRQCYEIVSQLSAEDVQHILGIDGSIRSADVKRKHGIAVGEDVPEKLVFNANTNVRWLDTGEVAMAAYSDYDGLALPEAALALLQTFDGRGTTAEVRARLRERYETDFSEEILLTLYRYRILVKA